MASLVTAALPVANTVIGAGQSRTASRQTASQNQAELEFRRQQAEREAELQRQQMEYERQQDLARQQAEREAEERRWQQEQEVRARDLELQRLAQEREWQREDELRRQDQRAREQELAREQALAEQQRRQAMDALLRGNANDLDQLRVRQDEEVRAAEGDAASRAAQIDAAADADERRRRDALRRAMGRTRAGLGAGGVSSADGSGEAILLGLVKDTGEERDDAVRADALKRQAIQQDLDARHRRNLLEQAQLAERQRLDFLGRFG